MFGVVYCICCKLASELLRCIEWMEGNNTKCKNKWFPFGPAQKARKKNTKWNEFQDKMRRGASNKYIISFMVSNRIYRRRKSAHYFHVLPSYSLRYCRHDSATSRFKTVNNLTLTCFPLSKTFIFSKEHKQFLIRSDG